PLTPANERRRHQPEGLGGHARSIWPIFARSRRLESPALVEFAIGTVAGARLAAEIEILLPGVAIGPPALMTLEGPKRPAILLQDHQIVASCGQRHALIFDHELSYSIISKLAMASGMMPQPGAS